MAVFSASLATQSFLKEKVQGVPITACMQLFLACWTSSSQSTHLWTLWETAVAASGLHLNPFGGYSVGRCMHFSLPKVLATWVWLPWTKSGWLVITARDLTRSTWLFTPISPEHPAMLTATWLLVWNKVSHSCKKGHKNFSEHFVAERPGKAHLQMRRQREGGAICDLRHPLLQTCYRLLVKDLQTCLPRKQSILSLHSFCHLKKTNMSFHKLKASLKYHNKAAQIFIAHRRVL